jgi:hypothetical protein
LDIGVRILVLPLALEGDFVGIQFRHDADHIPVGLLARMDCNRTDHPEKPIIGITR